MFQALCDLLMRGAILLAQGEDNHGLVAFPLACRDGKRPHIALDGKSLRACGPRGTGINILSPVENWRVMLCVSTHPHTRPLCYLSDWEEEREARHYGGALLMSDAEEVTRGGMSGSPILREDWRAIGVVCTGTSGPHARLMRGLAGWLLRELERAR